MKIKIFGKEIRIRERYQFLIMAIVLFLVLLTLLIWGGYRGGL